MGESENSSDYDKEHESTEFINIHIKLTFIACFLCAWDFFPTFITLSH